MTDLREDLSALEITQLEKLFSAEIPCESPRGCDNAATWRLSIHCPKCGPDPYCLCDACMQRIRECAARSPDRVLHRPCNTRLRLEDLTYTRL